MFFISVHLWCVWFHPLNICYLTFVQTNFNCFFFHSSTSCIYSWLPITRTLANSNQSRFPLDFLLTFTVILPSVTWTSRWLEVIFFPSAHFYTILPSIIRTMLIGAWKVGKKTVHWSPKHWIYFKTTKPILCLYFLSLQFKYSVHPIFCCLIAFPPHPFAYFLTSGYLLQTPDNSNFFQFPFKVRVIGSRL